MKLKQSLLKAGIGLFMGLSLLASTAVTSLPTEIITQKKADWTILGYFNGDNNLADNILSVVDHLEKEGSSEKVNIVILYDGNKDMKRYKDWEGTKLIHIKKDEKKGINSPTIDKGELDMGSPETLENFIQEALQKYPAKKNMMLFFTHGKGAAGDLIYKNGIFSYYDLSPDDTSVSGLTADKASEAMKKSLDGKKFDAMMMFTCVTNTPEFNYAVKDITKQVIASQDLLWNDENPPEFNPGINLTSIIKGLKQNPDMGKKELTKLVIDSLTERYNHPYSFSEYTPMPSQHLAGMESEKMDEFMIYFNNFSDTIKQRLEDKKTKETMVRILHKSIIGIRKYARLLYSDLYDFAEKIEQNTEDEKVKKACSELRDFIKKELIIYERYESPGREGYKPNGLLVYFPPAITGDFTYAHSQNCYKNSEFAKKTSWDEVIELFRQGVKEFKILEEFMNRTDKVC